VLILGAFVGWGWIRLELNIVYFFWHTWSVTHVIRSYTTTFAYRDECGRKVQRAQYGKGFQRPSISSALFCQFCHDLALPSGMVGYVPQHFNVFMQCSNISRETLVITIFKNSEELRRIIKPNPSGSWTFPWLTRSKVPLDRSRMLATFLRWVLSCAECASSSDDRFKPMGPSLLLARVRQCISHPFATSNWASRTTIVRRSFSRRFWTLWLSSKLTA